ncbi:hypothetical protein GE21DRAFT_4903 [Neurospora crassa]|uniref:NTF2 and RRM domain-containing protein n=1 Tax=Neurospora crassa (strain ATCC 24698 / 74-OR23-1A / CBS 708.71 / DSM 1257 / FGSC 987) TaxID=367110 RepID=Q7S118_NEUCR|nr:hypothetical protein NCU07574 [Neurospora crassa OR74A]EAA29032.2 hypothetical protein NCU07574 [Neurospora crassa OR74A]KHE78742.1 hypothetical protein GE21DRAFT_4903 [Neurospora crassa]|eukprot:XP_958268.2 hypothetical protein NCU07574 [Neurospora crassa OR74A]
MATNGNVNHSDQYAAPSSTTEAPATASSTTPQTQNQTLPKDEVGWYFVEQYYTTLSKNPEKLHLFYGKKSQFVYGQEAEVSSVSYGRQGIQERIKGLDFQDCKVRISNVDSQGSGDNIVIQVIGETSNKGAEPKKFVQTFVLAQQPSGYFVLNDMLRYIKEEGEEEVEEPAQEAAAAPEEETPAEPEAPVEAAPEPVEEAKQTEPEAAELDASAVDRELEEAAEEETPAAPVEAVPEPVEEAKQPEPEAAPEQAAEPEKIVEEITEEEVKKPEEPKAPTPTPAPAAAPRAAAPPAAEPEKPKEPPKPKTWANLVAVAAGPKPVVPLTKAATPAVPAQTRAAAPAAAQQPAAAPQAAETAAAPKEQANEWQTAETKRQSRPQSTIASAEKETAMAYIKYVTEKVKEEDLKGLLSSFGELVYFDINRTKNCAFVEFKTQAGYNAAVAANPHTVNGENIVVEQRRPKSTAFGGSNYGSSNRGGAAGRGRGGFEGGRSGSQSGGRGGFGGQSRGRGGANRGRAPTAQTPTA